MWVWYTVVVGWEGRAYPCRGRGHISECEWYIGVLSIEVGTIGLLAKCRRWSDILSRRGLLSLVLPRGYEGALMCAGCHSEVGVGHVGTRRKGRTRVLSMYRDRVRIRSCVLWNI